MNGETKIKGFWDIKFFDEKGNLKSHDEIKNTIVNSGFDGLIQRCFSSQTGSAAFNYIAIGSGTASASVSNTALGSESARGQGVYSHTNGQHNFSLSYTFGQGVGTGSVTEYGIFNASSNGQMWCRTLPTPRYKGTLDTCQINYTGSFA